MQQLQFVELDEGGRLVVATEDGTRYAVPVDDRLRAALRPRPATASDRETPRVSLRAVQSMIRAGQSAEEVASVTGWEVERVRRYEGPVLAEREHVIGLAQRAPVRAQGRTDGSHTLGTRVRERLEGRDVDPAAVAWDAARTTTHGPWTVQVIFTAGGRERRGAWHYDVQTRALEALDDEARWLSEDEQALPGGLAGHPLLGSGHAEDEVAADLMATMRERRQRRSRRPARRTSPEAVGDPGQPVGHVPGQQAMPPEVLPLEDLAYDPDTMGDPPAAHPRGAAPESPDPPEPDEAPVLAEGEDGSYARLRDPGEVSFDEFFDLDGSDEDGLHEDGSDEEAVDAGEVDPGDSAVEEDPGREGADLPADLSDASDEDESDGRTEPDDTAETDETPELAEPDEPDNTAETDDIGDEPTDRAERGAPSPSAEAAAEPEPPARPAGGRKGRPSVPSWDDIMFGARDRR